MLKKRILFSIVNFLKRPTLNFLFQCGLFVVFFLSVFKFNCHRRTLLAELQKLIDNIRLRCYCNAGVLVTGIDFFDDSPNCGFWNIVSLCDLVLAFSVEDLGNGISQAVVIIFSSRPIFQVHIFRQLSFFVELQLFPV